MRKSTDQFISENFNIFNHLQMVNSVDVEQLLFPVDAVEDEVPVLLEKV